MELKCLCAGRNEVYQLIQTTARHAILLKKLYAKSGTLTQIILQREKLIGLNLCSIITLYWINLTAIGGWTSMMPLFLKWKRKTEKYRVLWFPPDAVEDAER